MASIHASSPSASSATRYLTLQSYHGFLTSLKSTRNGGCKTLANTVALWIKKQSLKTAFPLSDIIGPICVFFPPYNNILRSMLMDVQNGFLKSYKVPRCNKWAGFFSPKTGVFSLCLCNESGDAVISLISQQHSFKSKKKSLVLGSLCSKETHKRFVTQELPSL